MFTLVHAGRPKAVLLQEAPALAASLVLAELFYKFHSFTLECVAFLATWYALGALQRLVTGRSRH